MDETKKKIETSLEAEKAKVQRSLGKIEALQAVLDELNKDPIERVREELSDGE